MRRSKRIAIGVMAAALALSMTACGGDVPEQPSNSGAGGTNTSTGSNTSTGTDTDDKKDDTTTTPPKENNKDDEKKDDAQVQSRTEKFFSGKNIVNGPQWTYTMQSQYWQEGKAWSGTIIMTSDGNRSCERKVNFTRGENIDTIYEHGWDYNYRIPVGERKIYEFPVEGYSHQVRGLGYNSFYYNMSIAFTRKFETGTYAIDGIVYYSETDTYPSSYAGQSAVNTVIYCYDMDDIAGQYLRYRIVEVTVGGQTVDKEINKITGISSTIDKSMLQVPEGYEVYRWDKTKQDYLRTGETTSKDTYPN